METSFQATGSFLGTNSKDMGTYSTIVRPDGTLYGEGRGVMISKDGEMATWTGHGVGVTKKDGAATYCGAIYYQTMPTQWSRLSKVGKHALRILGIEVASGVILVGRRLVSASSR
jgi:hypothetical protein